MLGVAPATAGLGRVLARWTSANPERARTECFLLLYTPVWVTAVASVMLSGALASWRDAALFGFTGAVLVPMIVGSAYCARNSERPLWDNHALKLNVWVGILVWSGSYFYSHYFFERMGMVYRFQSHWHLEAELMGSPSNEVPLFLYPLTQVYFLSYHTLMVMSLRRLHRALGRQWWITAGAVLGLAYAMAFAETFFMATEPMKPYFHYGDRQQMLRVGSTMFAMIFVVSLPMIYRFEESPGDRWSYRRVALDALAASMLALMLLDAWALLTPPVFS